MHSKPKTESIPWHSIALCPNGHVLLRLGFTTVHLTINDFQELYASSREFMDACDRNPQWLEPDMPNRELHH